jgi:hypothetical protein
MSKWLDAITELRQEQAEKPAAGFLPLRDIARKEGRSVRQMSEIVRALVDAGRAEKRIFRVPRPLAHYRMK